jgi:hypothetical protein
VWWSYSINGRDQGETGHRVANKEIGGGSKQREEIKKGEVIKLSQKFSWGGNYQADSPQD